MSEKNYKKLGKIVSIRFSEADYMTLSEISRNQGKDVSKLIRTLIMMVIALSDKK
jgi:hypothetical protein